MGAKNHAVLMPDGEHMLLDSRLLLITCIANKNLALNSIIGAAFGGKAFLVILSRQVNCVDQLLGRDAWLSLCVSILGKVRRPEIEGTHFSRPSWSRAVLAS